MSIDKIHSLNSQQGAGKVIIACHFCADGLTITTTTTYYT